MPQSSRARRPSAILAALAALVLIHVTPAYADDPVPGAAAIQQYVESMPTGSGPAVPGVSSRNSAQLPAAAVESLKYAPPSIASVLAEVATSPEYGAPASQVSSPTDEPISESAGSALLRSLDAAGTADDTTLLALIAVLLVLTAAAGVFAARGTRI